MLSDTDAGWAFLLQAALLLPLTYYIRPPSPPLSYPAIRAF